MSPEQRVAVLIEALEYIASREDMIGIPKWDAEFVDVAQKALLKYREADVS